MMTVKSVIAAALLAVGAAQAAEAPFPNRPIHFVIPGAAGSAPVPLLRTSGRRPCADAGSSALHPRASAINA